VTGETSNLARPLDRAFKMAVLHGTAKAVTAHIHHGKDVNARDVLGRSPLMLAASKGRSEICRLLLETGADPWLTDDEGKNALVIAEESHQADVERLLREGMALLSTEGPGTDDANRSGDASHGAPEDDIDQEFDLSVWEEEHDSPPPPADPACLAQASEIQKHISRHDPVDTDEDWSDIDVYFPDYLLSHQHKSLNLDSETLEAIRQLMLAGLCDGRVPAEQISALIPVDSDDEGEISLTMQSALRLVLGEIGILVDEVPGGPDISDPLENDPDDSDERLIDEALDFFTSVIFQWEDVIFQREEK
jgi:RNA polymerase primary sigma factor